MSRTARSPAGQEILVLDDAEVRELLGTSKLGSALVLSSDRHAIVDALWRHGPYTNKSGRATGLLAKDAGLDVRTVTNVHRQPIMAQCIERQGNGRRTHFVNLVAMPKRWLPSLNGVGHAVEPEAETVEPEVEPEVETVEPSLIESTLPPLWISTRDVSDYDPAGDHRIADAVATALLAQVAQILTHGTPDNATVTRLEAMLSEAQDRLARQVDYTSTLRQQMRLASDELIAVKQERDGLRTRLRNAEHNLKAATTGDARRIIDAEVRRQIERFMQEKPAAKAAGE